MKASTRLEAKQAFVLDQEDFIKLCKILGQITPVIETKILCSDGLTRIPERIEEVVAYENSRRSSIVSIEIHGSAEDRGASSDLVIGGQHSNSISLSLRGEEQEALKVRMEVADFLDGLRPWYSRIAIFDMFLFWAPVLIILLFSSKMMLPENQNPVPMTWKQTGVSVLVVIAVMILLFYAVSGVAKLKKACFPVSTFAMGQGLKRHQLLENIRWTIVVGFLVSITGSCVFALQPWLR